MSDRCTEFTLDIIVYPMYDKWFFSWEEIIMNTKEHVKTNYCISRFYWYKKYSKGSLWNKGTWYVSEQTLKILT